MRLEQLRNRLAAQVIYNNPEHYLPILNGQPGIVNRAVVVEKSNPPRSETS